MITRPSCWDSVQAQGQFSPLPAGGYECKIVSVKVEPIVYNNQAWQILKLALDITAGEHKDEMSKRFAADTRPEKKWPCTHNIWLPDNSGDERDQRNAQILKTFVTCVEHSNPGYTFDFNENTLKSKAVGFLFQRRQFMGSNGKTGFTTSPYRPMSIKRIREGNFTIPADKLLKTEQTTMYAPIDPANPDGFTPVPSEELPF